MCWLKDPTWGGWCQSKFWKFCTIFLFHSIRLLHRLVVTSRSKGLIKTFHKGRVINYVREGLCISRIKSMNIPGSYDRIAIKSTETTYLLSTVWCTRFFNSIQPLIGRSDIHVNTYEEWRNWFKKSDTGFIFCDIFLAVEGLNFKLK